MGLLDRIKSGVSNAVSSVKETVSDAVQKTEDVAEKVVTTAKDDFQAVAKPVVDLAANVASHVPVVPTSGNELAHEIGDATRALGKGMQDAGGLLEKGGKLLEPFSPVGTALQELGKDATGLGKGVSAAPDVASRAAGVLAEDAGKLADRASNLWDQAKSVFHSGVEGAKEALKVVEAGVNGVIDTATSYVNGVKDAVDYHKNIDELGPGDTYKLGMGGYGSIEGGKIYGAGSLSVSKGTDGKYTIATDGELGGGLYGQLGAALGGKMSADGSVTLGAGGKVEFKFDNAEDAKKAADIMMKQAAAAAGPARPLGVPGSDPGLVKGPSQAELKFLQDHMSAVELRGNVAAQAAATLGVKDVAGGFAGVGVKEEMAVRVDLSHPPQVSVRTDISGNAAISAGLNVTNGKQGNDNNTGSLAFGGGKAEGKVSIEQRFTLPEGEGAKLLADPIGTLQADAGKIQRTEQDKVTFTLDASGGAMGSGGGGLTTVTMNTSPGEIAKSGALKTLFDKGDLPGALRQVGNATNVTATAVPYQTFGVSMSPSISVMGFGLGVSVEATRQQMARTPAWQYPAPGGKATASQAYDELAELMKKAAPYAKPQLPLAQIRA